LYFSIIVAEITSFKLNSLEHYQFRSPITDGLQLTTNLYMLISTKLLSLLKTFSKHELNSFKKFVASPFHNEQQELVQLFAIIDQHFRASEKVQKTNPLQKEIVWKYIFDKKPYNDVRLRRLSSDLIKLVYSFLSYNIYKKNGLSESLNLLKVLRQLSLKKHFDSTLNQLNHSLEKNELRNSDYHLSSYNINYNLFNFPKDFRSKINLFSNLEKADYHLECFFIIKKLENYCDYIGYREGISFNGEISLPPNFLDYVENSVFINEPALKAYFFVTKMLLNSKETTFFLNLKEHLAKNKIHFSLQELDVFYTHLKNFCIVKINIGQTEYFNRLFDIFKTLVSEKIILKEGIISHQSYKNIVTVGLKIEEYNWVENFIQEYTKHLPKEHRENTIAYNLAKVYFYQNQFNDVIKLLREVEYKNHVYALGGKLLLLKTYYELKEYNPLDSLIDSFRIYIRRNKIISKEVKQQYLNLLRFVKKLSSTIAGDKKSVEKIRAQIAKCKALAGKKWILEKVEELAK